MKWNKEHKKEYKKEWDFKNKEHKKEYNKEWRLKNKEHRKEYSKQWNLKNKEYKKEYNKEWNLKNPAYRKEYKKEWNLKNTEYIKEYKKEWNFKNKEHRKEYDKEWYLKNTEYIKEYNLKNIERRRKYQRNKKRTNPYFRLACNMGTAMSSALQGRKKSSRTMKIIGCTVEELFEHFESCSSWEPWMTRKNYGRGGWDADHIIPISQWCENCPLQFILCWDKSNLQPMEHIANVKKGNRYEVE